MIKKAFERLGPDRKLQIMRDGLELYTQFAFEDVTIRMIVEKLGINMATFYRYFSEKEDLALTVYKDIVSRYLQSDINVFRAKSDMSAMTEQEKQFLQSVYDWPDYMYRKLIFEQQLEYSLPLVRQSLQKERLDGNLRNNVVEDFAAYIYCTAEYNLWCYCKANQITDADTIAKLSRYMDESLFMEGIMLPKSEQE